MARSISILTILLYSICYIGCGVDEGFNAPSVPDYESSVRRDRDVRVLLAITDEIVTRALASGASGAEIARMIQQNDKKRLASILGYTERETVELEDRITRLGERLRNRYPGLFDAAGNRKAPCPECGLEQIAERWDNLLVTDGKSITLGDGENQMVPVPEPSDKGVTCRWAPYVATLVGCTAFGLTPLYLACAIIALCEFCTGGWVSLFCQH